MYHQHRAGRLRDGRHGGDLTGHDDDRVADKAARHARHEGAERVGQPVDRIRVGRIVQMGHGGEHAGRIPDFAQG